MRPWGLSACSILPFTVWRAYHLMFQILGVGLMGSMFILTVSIYGELATFFTGSHAHGTVIGVRGNIGLTSILFYVQHVITLRTFARAV